MPIIIDPFIEPPEGGELAYSSDRKLLAISEPKWGGVLLVIDISDVTPKAHRIRLLRNAGGLVQAVRGADPTPYAANNIYAYDHEAPLGTTCGWHAELLDRAGKVIGVSQTVTLRTNEPEGGPNDPGVWLKSLDRPTLSMQLMLNSWPDENYVMQQDLQEIWGRRNPIGGLGVMGGLETEIKFLLDNSTQIRRARQLASVGGLVFIQAMPRFQKPDFYGVVDKIKISNAIADKHSADYRYMTLSVVEVDRPITQNSVSRIPQRTFEDRQEQHPFFYNVPARTFLDAWVKGGG